MASPQAVESVWDYPRPPRVERSSERIRVVHAGRTIADTTGSLRMLETSHPPTYYLPPDDVDWDLLRGAPGSSWCEWKGQASYYDVVVAQAVAERAAWAYPEPVPAFTGIAGHLAFYANRVDECWVGGERVQAQAGDFYGGWITSTIRGPFKGEPGTRGW